MNLLKMIKQLMQLFRNFGIIGEAANKIPDEIKKYNKIDWSKIVGLRNRVIHDYFGVDLEIIWFIIKNELNDLKNELDRLV